jgi:hypothetical protein
MNAVENIHNIEFLANQMFVLEKLKQWQKAKPDNQDLKQLINKYLEITFYVIRLEQDAVAKNMLISQYREEKNILKLKLRELKDE